MVGSSGDNNKGEMGIKAVASVVEEPNIFIAEPVTTSLLFMIPGWRALCQNVLILIIAVALVVLVVSVEVLTGLGVIGKILHVNMSTPLPTSILTMSLTKLQITLNSLSSSESLSVILSDILTITPSESFSSNPTLELSAWPSLIISTDFKS